MGEQGYRQPIKWELGPDATFADALAAHGNLLEQASQAAAALPQKDIARHCPATMQDAVSLVHARAEESKKKAASKQKSKSKAGGGANSPTSTHFPGAVEGGGDASAFWMYIEVGSWGGGSGRGPPDAHFAPYTSAQHSTGERAPGLEQQPAHACLPAVLNCRITSGT